MATDQTELTENKRRVITLLKDNGPLSKGELAAQGSMGWATVVKVVGQLTESKIVEKLGTVRQDTGKKGKRAYLYGLTGREPLAVGVDVEYRTTSMVLTNLLGETLAHQKVPTVIPVSDRDIRKFLIKTIADFIGENADFDRVRGIGIGIPGIGFPSNSRLDNIEKMRELEIHLSESLCMPVRVIDNTKAYAVFEQWSNQTFPSEDFLFISIRTGVGTGIFHDGNLYVGTHGLSGEIGHIPVVQDKRLCRCGNRGCMETFVGERNLYEAYRRRVLDSPLTSETVNPEMILKGLADLFSRASRGEGKALQIVTEAAEYLGRCLAAAVMVLDITNIVLSGHFGADGNVILGPLEKVVRENLLPGAEFTLK
jgi:predicted NBD/HSP70 family sugar kinase